MKSRQFLQQQEIEIGEDNLTSLGPHTFRAYRKKSYLREIL